ncbi:hypothetical protein [Arthrobacter sp. AZCC_0090]|uniref:hypothetical protein n=1 Tax=Arthrobacter sp. AZCC_0090 TaxID=2735881 RepID=UPI0016174418|nr:hypothetical protein [Arthrobacter sp. AZCC_0090]MBB6407082.1 hypothetical protein [Arthrobacter sp. AZCC_0090]
MILLVCREPAGGGPVRTSSSGCPSPFDTREATSRDNVGVILVDAAGPAFCIAGDLVATAIDSGEAATAFAELIHTRSALLASKIPVVAAEHATADSASSSPATARCW